jgi:hypothetical protein
VLPKSGTPNRTLENFQDFVLSQQAVEKINALDRNRDMTSLFEWVLTYSVGEFARQTLRKGVRDWVESQRKAKTKAEEVARVPIAVPGQ